MKEYKTKIPVKLGSIDRDSLLHFMMWRNQPSIMKRTRQWKLLTMEDQEIWYDSIVGAKWPESIMFTIEASLVENTTDKTSSFFTHQFKNKDKSEVNLSWQGVGVAGLCYIDYIARSAELSIYIGSKSYQRKGIGTATVQLLKEWAFNKMNLRKIWAEVYDHVEPVHEFVKANGFKEVGRLPDTVFKDGDYQNSIYYAYYDTEYMHEKAMGKV